MALAAGAANGACPQDQGKNRPAKTSKTARAQMDGCVDLGAVPQISANIVAAEPAATPVRKPSYVPPEPAKYEGPTIGLTKPEPGVRPAPTVGYKWSLQ
jgi:hypothetical protein